MKEKGGKETTEKQQCFIFNLPCAFLLLCQSCLRRTCMEKARWRKETITTRIMHNLLKIGRGVAAIGIEEFKHLKNGRKQE